MDFLFPINLTQDFVQRISGTFGEAGTVWLQELPLLLRDCFRDWNLKPEYTPDCLTYNYVVFVSRGNAEKLVLKAGVPHPELNSEIEAMKLYAGEGAAKLLDSDAQKGLLLLEKLQPGKMLLEEKDDKKATAIAADVMRRLWKEPPADHCFRSVRDWGKGFERLRCTFNGGCGPFPARLLSKAETLFTELSDSMETEVVLHGDLHHWNVLQADERGWLAIDPKGVLGEPAYEIGAWLRNPAGFIFKMPDLKKVQKRRMEQFATELGFERERLRDWSIAQAVLSAWWSYEDKDDGIQEMLGLAELLSEIRW